jgi:NADPH:quinone reductase-like Zn-dependent oxidoreductase
VHGANGGVGSVLVQLAHAAGVTVIGTASARHHDALLERGVIPVDYRTEDIPARVRELAPGGVDAVFDHVGGRSVLDSWNLLAPGGTRGDIAAQIAAQLPLTRIADALRLAESGTVAGKIILNP